MNKLIIITGITSGLGKKIYNCIKSSDYYIITISRRNCNYNNTKNHYHITKDLSNINDIKSINFKIFNIKFDKIIFINNAFDSSIGNIGNIENDFIINCINTNIISSLIIINKIIKLKTNLKIINITSGVINKTIEGWGLYCSSKTFIENILNHIDIENNNIDIVNFNPGVFDSNIQLKLRNSELKNKKYFENLNFKSLDNIVFELIQII